MKNMTVFTILLLAFCMLFSAPIAKLQSAQETKKIDNEEPLNIVVRRKMSEDKHKSPTEDEILEFDEGKSKLAQKAKRVLTLNKFRDKLLQKGVPFDPNFLAEEDWRKRISDYQGFMSSISSQFLSDGLMEGAVIADTLYLPESTKLKGDTIIFANKIVFEGKDVTITGHHDIAVFAINPPVTTERVQGFNANEKYTYEANSAEFANEFFTRNRVVQNGNIAIDVSGLGRENSKLNKNPFDQLSEEIDRSGGTGRDGDEGAWRIQGNDGADSPDPVDGTCSVKNAASGQDTDTAGKGGTGQTGGNAPQPDVVGGAIKGDDGNEIIYDLLADDTCNYTFISKGGDGGYGGRGGRGGDGGPGGDGKRGGNGISCGCTVGNGGNGGNAGEGGDSGGGGGGADGADGGKGGQIKIFRYPGNSSEILGNSVKGGKEGKGGSPGDSGNPGLPGDVGDGGSPGSSNCGIEGQIGDQGEPATIGRIGFPSLIGGNDGSPGQDGSYSLSDLSTEDGGGGGPIEPEQPCNDLDSNNSCCTPHYWNHYQSYDGGQTWVFVSSTYAGCF